MPFHSHHQQHSHTGSQGAVQGLFEAAQTLGSIGAPTGNLRTAALGTTAAGTDALLPSNSSTTTHQHSHASSALPPSNTSQPPLNNYNSYDGPRRSNTIGRMADNPSSYQSSPHIQEPQHQGGTYSNSQAANSLPGSLQPAQGRPNPNTVFTAPSGVPQLNTNASQYSLPTRSNTMHSHSHSRSSPAGLDQQKYVLNLPFCIRRPRI
jgi:WD repeat-containing protein 68